MNCKEKTIGEDVLWHFGLAEYDYNLGRTPDACHLCPSLVFRRGQMPIPSVALVQPTWPTGKAGLCLLTPLEATHVRILGLPVSIATIIVDDCENRKVFVSAAVASHRPTR
jgi:hypothetical protein